MFGKSGFVKRVHLAVDQVLEPGEERRAAVYVQGPARPPTATAAEVGAASAVADAGDLSHQMRSAWPLGVTNRRLVVLAMDGVTAKSATLAAAFPVDEVRSAGSSKSGFDLLFPGAGRQHYEVLLVWRKEAAALQALLPREPSET
jgi:hypothetical protein